MSHYDSLSGGAPLRVLAFLDDTVVSGKVKPVLTLARYARDHPEYPGPLDLSMLTFVRGESDPEFVEALRREGFSIDVVRERRRFDLAVFEHMRAIVAKQRPDILWTHGAKTHFLVRIAGLHRQTAWVASHHGYTATSLVWRLYDQLDRWSLRGADAVTAPCDAFVADLNHRLGIAKVRLSVHRTPIAPTLSPQPNRTQPGIRADLGLPADARIVLSIGRLSKEKGHADLIRAMTYLSRMPEQVALVIVGDGPEEARLEQLSKELDLANAVRLVGYKDDVTPYYETADVFALPSYSEGAPNVLLEAMDAGVPIVATAVGGIGEMIRHREEGWLVPSGNPQEVARGIEALLADADLRARLVARARQSLTVYAPAHYYASLGALFRSVVKTR